jgi:hypothetical protein
MIFLELNRTEVTASNVKLHKISPYLAPINPEFEPKSVVVVKTVRTLHTDY